MKRPTPSQGLKAMIRFAIVCFLFAMIVNFLATHYRSRYPSTTNTTTTNNNRGFLNNNHNHHQSNLLVENKNELSYFSSMFNSNKYKKEDDDELNSVGVVDDDGEDKEEHLYNNNNNDNIACSIAGSTNKDISNEHHKTEYHDMDVVIVMVAPVCTTQQVVERLNFHYHFRKIYFVVKQTEICPYLQSLAKNIICLDENKVIPGVTYASLAQRGEKLKQIGQKEGSNRVGWYLQQYLKLGVALHVKDLSEYYLVWDADNIATRPLELVRETVKSENYAVRFCANPVTHKSTGYAKFYKRILGDRLMKPGGYPKDPKGDSFNYVCGFMVMKREYVKEMTEYITKFLKSGEDRHLLKHLTEDEKRFPWDIHAIANEVATVEGGHYYFSEYDTYGSWVQKMHADEHQVDYSSEYARNPTVAVAPSSLSEQEFKKLARNPKNALPYKFPCCMKHEKICERARKAARTSDGLVHVLVWEEHKMRYRGSQFSQCTDKMPKELQRMLDQSDGDGVKPDR